ncbi:GCN5-related N-acetyltransferase [[Leptolyngbya] sp. PCC 7376]|uniref:GNAT family N-acetyltransferase n=1 Tax=[Leptolyngbya] sp. PCC 7376 TaxID=111781 RepID=UPI00029F42B9|nr:GNAT family N-acetyltransferase [[Leptolyngbya] sp. PCC 7376]AFY40127.1 GCN5-related N-acetyltransferase [[Leptolyngbya] sp. PCC 7376]
MGTADMNSIIKATFSDADLIAETLGEAFDDDPVISYLLGASGNAYDFFRSLFQHIYLPFNCSFYLANDQGEMMGCALWSKPGQDPNALSLGFFKVLWQNRRNLTFSSLQRLFSTSNLSMRYHPKEPHYYLCAIGVNLSFRRQGAASRLLASVLTMADQEQVSVYLENSKEQNLAFYQKNGFKVVHKHILANDGPPIWFMQRSPQNPPQA